MTQFITHPTPLGEVCLAATDRGWRGLYFENHRHPPAGRHNWLPLKADNSPAARNLAAARTWLDHYFADPTGAHAVALPDLDTAGGTGFQQRVWRALAEIPPGTTVSYSDIARRLGAPRSTRAVGAAIGRNPLSIVIPCHRIIGANGQLTGYAGEIWRKRWLLAHEAGPGGHYFERPSSEMSGLFGAESGRIWMPI